MVHDLPIVTDNLDSNIDTGVKGHQFISGHPYSFKFLSLKDVLWRLKHFDDQIATRTTKCSIHFVNFNDYRKSRFCWFQNCLPHTIKSKCRGCTTASPHVHESHASTIVNYCFKLSNLYINRLPSNDRWWSSENCTLTNCHLKIQIRAFPLRDGHFAKRPSFHKNTGNFT